MAINTQGIIAYPVPYNPRLGVLTIRDVTNTGFNKIKVEVLDINGDLVYRQLYPLLPAVWNGRNGKGRTVKPGLYILKISLEDIFTGLEGKKIIRILVQY